MTSYSIYETYTYKNKKTVDGTIKAYLDSGGGIRLSCIAQKILFSESYFILNFDLVWILRLTNTYIGFPFKAYYQKFVSYQMIYHSDIEMIC